MSAESLELPLNAGNPEAELSSRLRGPAVAAFILVAAVALLLMPLPQLGRVTDAIGDIAHIPLFAGLAVVVHRGLTRHWFTSGIIAALFAWLAVSMVGIFAEWLQQFVGREASFGDGLSDVLGSAAGLLWTGTSTGTSRGAIRIRRVIAISLVAIAAWLPATVLFDVFRRHSQMPVLASFEDEVELMRWDPHDAQIGRVRSHAADGAWALEVDALDDGYPGAILRWPPRDWSAYQVLAFSASCEAGEELRLTLKVQDDQHNNHPDDRFQRTFELTPTMTRFTIPLSEVMALRSGRTLDLRAVSLVQFYISKPGRPRTFYLDAIRLEHP